MNTSQNSRHADTSSAALRPEPGHDSALAAVQAVYSGPEGRLWELLMGEQIHIGGLASSLDLAERAGIGPGMRGVDLCCASGAGMRCLIRFRDVASMTGVDATPAMLELARRRCQEEGLSNRVTFIEANVCETHLPSSQSDFVWGEDAWCYVQDKARLVTEAVRLLKPGGVIAFTDWMTGSADLPPSDLGRLCAFMKFPNVYRLQDYASRLKEAGCTVRTATDTGRFASHCRLYIDMLEKQLTYDALKLIGFNHTLAESLVAEMRFLLALAEAGSLIQGLVIGQKPA